MVKLSAVDPLDSTGDVCFAVLVIAKVYDGAASLLTERSAPTQTLTFWLLV
jgi:hypothetical protein